MLEWFEKVGARIIVFTLHVPDRVVLGVLGF